MRRSADHPATAWVLAAVAFVIAAAGAEPYAGSWNDGSRLAAVESLIDRGTFAIDDSIFVHPPPESAGPSPYTPAFPTLRQFGTRDMVRVDGRFYSDKPAIPGILTAGAYRALMFVGLPSPGRRPDVFCWVAAVLTGGLSYAAAVGCMWEVGRRSGLSAGWRLVWLGGFALATVLPAYTRQVNTGIQQVAVLAGLAVLLSRAAAAEDEGRTAWAALVGVGALTGFGYALDQGSGPLLVVAVGAAVAVRFRRFAPVAVVAGAALPWVVAHHAVNYAIGRVWVPLGMVPEYLAWPGSPFDESNMTGFGRHTPVSFVVYAWTLLLGEPGILLHNPPLLLAAAVGWLVLLRPGRDRVEIAALVGWCVATWLVYAVLSDNGGGWALSVRWFVPFVVPGFWLLARLLAERPAFRPDFLALAGWGCVLGRLMWTVGGWASDFVPYFWPVVGATLFTWAVVRGPRVGRAIVRWRKGRHAPVTPQ